MEIGSNFGQTLNDLAIQGTQRVQSSELGQEDFLRLMVEQLRHQNPLEPQDNSEFFTQIAQFSMLDTMREIAEAMHTLAAFSELANASALVGRTVTATLPLGPDPDTGFPRDPEVVAGTVERITFGRGGPVVHIAGRQFPLAFISEVA